MLKGRLIMYSIICMKSALDKVLATEEKNFTFKIKCRIKQAECKLNRTDINYCITGYLMMHKQKRVNEKSEHNNE